MSDKKRTILDLGALQLKTKPLEGSNRPASLAVKTWGNKVSVAVYTGLDSLPRKGIIGLNIHPLEFAMVLGMLEELTEIPYSEAESTKIARKMKVYNKAGGKDKELYGEFVVGRDQQGIYYICIIATDNAFPKVVFRLLPPRSVEIEGDLESYKISRIFTRAWIDFYRTLMPIHIMDNFADESNGSSTWKGKSGGNSNSSGSSNNSSNYDEDDIPF